MERQEIRTAALALTDRFSLLVLLNRIKQDELGDKAYPFTIEQLNYFCNPERNINNYTTFSIPKKSGGVRMISAPTMILKSLLWCTNKILQSLYEPSACAMGFVPGRSIVDNASAHVGMNYVFNTDLSDFFPSINKSRVWATLKSKSVGLNPKVAEALAGLCTTKMEFLGDKPLKPSDEIPEGAQTEFRYVLPQGSPASPILTNMVCVNLDRRLTGLAKRFTLKYTRYADDTTFSSLHNVYQENGEFMTELRRIIAEQNLQINERKTRVQKAGSRQEVTGLVVCKKVNTMKKYVRGLNSLLFIWEHYGYDSAYASLLKHNNGNYRKGVRMERVIEGRLLFLKMVKGADDPVYIKLRERFDVLNYNGRHSDRMPGFQYIASYTVPAFEKQFSTKVEVALCKTLYHASCIFNGEKIPIRVHASLHKRFADDGIEETMKRLYMVYVTSGFWKLTPYTINDRKIDDLPLPKEDELLRLIRYYEENVDKD